ncbi:MAG: hypothetical protein ACHQ50_10370 [Fimbriimonadales bacterium]
MKQFLLSLVLFVSLVVVVILGLTGIWVDWSLSPCEGHRELRWAWDEAAKANARAKVEMNIRTFLAVREFHKNAGDPGKAPLWMDCAACNRKLDRDSEREMSLQRTER